MGKRILAFDWSATSLGSPHTWPAALKTLVGVMLGAGQAMFIAWGDDNTLLYNDAYGEILGRKHPLALGRPIFEVWYEIREELKPLFDQVWAGQPVHMSDITLQIERHGYTEEAHFAFSYTPVRDEAGVVRGVFCPCLETTSQVFAERNLKNATERQRRLFEQAPGFITILQGPEHVFEFVNHAYNRLFGNRNYVGLTVREAFPDLASQPFFDLLDGVYATGERYIAQHIPVLLQAVPGAPEEELFLDLVYEPIVDENGEVTGIFVEGHDVTQAHLVQEALQASDRQFSAMAQSMPNQVWTADSSGELDWFNEQVYQFSGMPHGSLNGEDWWNIVHPDDEDPAKVRWARAVSAGEPYENEFRLRRHDGAWRWHIARAAPIYSSAGKVLRWVGTRTDIHDQKAAAEELRLLNETLEARVEQRTAERDRVWRNSRDLLVIIGADGIFRAVNPAWADILGHVPEEVEGRSFLEFVWPEDVERSQGGFLSAALSIDLTNFESRHRHKDGTPRWISWHTSVEGDSVYGYGRHITAEKNQARALLRTEEQLRQAQKMEAVGQLTGGIAHDFNNLLAGIVGSLDIIQSRLAQGRFDAIERFTNTAMNSAQRAAALTHRLLAFARRQPLDPKALNANQMLCGMEELLRRTLGPLYRLEIFTGRDLWATRCDPNQLESSILNLVLNARDAMPGGGKLVIQATNMHLDAGSPLHPQEMNPGEYVAIAITDTGSGMSADVIKHAFEPFFTTKPLGQGTGLGLSMVYGFVRQSEGHLHMTSAPGEGTTVRVFLPRYHGDVDQDDAAGSGEVPRSRRGETVLLVEDEPIVRELVVEVLQDLGYRVLMACDGPAGLEILQSSEPIDLLVSDVGLPGLNGRQMADLGLQVRPGLKVLFITGYAESAAGAQGFLEPGMEMMTKPFAVDSLAAKVREMLLG